MRKIQLILICILLFSSCDGSLGGFDDRIFPTSKKKLEVALDQLYLDHPQYIIPDKWKDFDSWSRNGYDFLESRIFYLREHPEEMYYVSFVGDSAMLANPKQVVIAIRAVNKGDYKWYLEEDCDKKERERIESRFDQEIISKLEGYTQCKAKRD
ncbi:hypothetical protein [Daejeonella oryzae]|uniref:hypothetical protein n=1 Tax=Daejeonella oryzae TaxID=1122943 RepID=UPI00047DA5EB|nr:hypothetical protein [Daejeonella oryzae]